MNKKNKKDYREHIFKEKEKYHKKLAKLSFSKKLEILNELQKIATEVKKMKGEKEVKEMTEGVPYLPTNGEITFREPFPTVRYEPMKTYYFKVSINGMEEQEYRTRARNKIEAIDREKVLYKKLLNAKAIIKKGKLEFTQHSPQLDFLSLVI